MATDSHMSLPSLPHRIRVRDMDAGERALFIRLGCNEQTTFASERRAREWLIATTRRQSRLESGKTIIRQTGQAQLHADLTPVHVSNNKTRWIKPKERRPIGY